MLLIDTDVHACHAHVFCPSPFLLKRSLRTEHAMADYIFAQTLLEENDGWYERGEITEGSFVHAHSHRNVYFINPDGTTTETLPPGCQKMVSRTHGRAYIVCPSGYVFWPKKKAMTHYPAANWEPYCSICLDPITQPRYMIHAFACGHGVHWQCTHGDVERLGFRCPQCRSLDGEAPTH